MKSNLRGLDSKIKILLFVRMLVIVGALCAVVLVGLANVDRQGDMHFRWAPYIVLIFACFANLVFLVCFWKGFRRQPLAAAQIFLDAVLVAALVYVTGGEQSPFAVLFFLSVLGAGITGGTAWGLGAAGSATLFMLFVTVLYGAWSAELVSNPPFLTRDILGLQARNVYESLGFVLLESGAFFLVGILSGNLTQRLYGSVRLTDTILDNMSEGLFVVGRSGEIVYINQPAMDLLQIRDSDPIGRNVYDLLGRHGYDELAKTIGSGEPNSNEYNLYRPDNTRAPVYVTSSPLAGLRGDEGVLVMIFDLTERQKIKDAEKRMAYLESLGQMAASIAHEIRNPLASIRGSAQQLKGLDLDESHKKLLSLIVQNSDRLDQIISEFLVFARPKRLSPRKIFIEDILGEVALMISQHYPDGGPEVLVDASRGLQVKGDRDQILQVFLNLAINACEAMNQGGTLTMRAWNESESGCPGVGIEFRDTGMGIKHENIEKLFQPFYTTKPKGTGLGLAIVHKIIEAHGGRLDVASERGKGTVVSLWVPNEET